VNPPARAPSPGLGPWAVALAALVGTAAGSFLAASIASALVTAGWVLGGSAAIYVASALGAVVGAGVAALVAFSLARFGWFRIGALAGALLGIAVGGAMGYVAESFAQSWIAAFSGNPPVAALVGGGLAGSLVGVAVAAALRILRRSGMPVKRAVQFAGLVGSLAGAFAGVGGASIGIALAEATTLCPNGYYSNPGFAAGCAVGVASGALLLGLWVGALMGAVGAMTTAEILGLLPPPASVEPRAD